MAESSVVVPHVDEISIFLNNDGNVVIAQESMPDEVDEVIFSPIHIPQIVKALEELKAGLE